MSTWTSEQLSTITHRMKECEKKKKEHLGASRIYDTFDKATGLPQVILSSVLSTSAITQASDDNDSETLRIFIAVSSVCLAILTSTSRFFEFGKRKESHKKAGHIFGRLQRTLEFEISRSVKQDYDTLFETTLNEYNSAKENSHLISSFVKKLLKME